jgi:DNA-directed RNA polymerase subunit RPC12/RpoP
MQVLSDRVAYLKGLAEGLAIGEQSKEGRLIGAIIEVLGDVAKVLADLTEKHSELDEYVESIDEDLAELEEALLDEEDIDEDDEDEDDEDDEDETDDGYDGLIEYDCPHCGHTIYFDAETFDMQQDNACPNCGKQIFSTEDGAKPEPKG